ncbi:MAG TPA: hypothetical protein VHD32_08900 [Candidatus Didemnitutus sp.]|nr:hypothetical protein [Candidatus Didemnitutus sp.]
MTPLRLSVLVAALFVAVAIGFVVRDSLHRHPVSREAPAATSLTAR